MSYVTGSHNVKVGFEMQRGHFWRGDNNDSTGGIWYTTTAGVPAFVTIQAPASGWQNNLNYNLGIYAQDRWTVNRLTLSGGVRLDLLNESTEAFTLGPHRWLPNRNTALRRGEERAELEGHQPARARPPTTCSATARRRSRRAPAAAWSRTRSAIAAANNPAATVRTQTSRAWNDVTSVPAAFQATSSRSAT